MNVRPAASGFAAAQLTRELLMVSIDIATRYDKFAANRLVLIKLASIPYMAASSPGCITVYNWMSLLTATTGLPLIALRMAGVAPDVIDVPSNILLIVWLVWEAFLLKHALRIAMWQAVPASIADYLFMQHLVLPMFLAAGSVT
jgi:hypothetical protein